MLVLLNIDEFANQSQDTPLPNFTYVFRAFLKMLPCCTMF